MILSIGIDIAKHKIDIFLNNQITTLENKKSAIEQFFTRCTVPENYGKFYPNKSDKEKLWDKYYMQTPKRQRKFVEKYKIVKKA